MGENPLLSIIIPVYNSEAFISECIQSIKTLRITSEIIIINDGSTDNSEQIILNEAKRNYVYIKQENSGYGSACNKGLNNAKGKYFAILEPDDYVVEGFYENLITIAEKEHADITAYRSYIRNLKKIHRLPLNFTERLIEFCDSGLFWYRAPCLWNAIYRTEKFKFCRFVETKGASYQDVMFQIRLERERPTLYIINDAKYIYREHAAQSVKNADKKIAEICEGWIRQSQLVNEQQKSYFFARLTKQIAGTSCSWHNKCILYAFLYLLARISKHNLKFIDGIRKPFHGKYLENIPNWIIKKIRLWRRK